MILGCRSGDSGSSEAGAPVDRRKAAVLRVATSGDYRPFSVWPAGSREPIGFSISVANAYAEDSGVGLEWVRFRWPELASDLTAGSFDFAISGVTVRPDRSMRGRFAIPLTTSGAVILVEAESSFETTQDLDRASIRIAVNAGGHLERVARRFFPSARVKAIPNNAEVLGLLLRGAAEAVLTDTAEAAHWQQDAKIDLREIGPLTRDHKAAWFPPGHEAQIDRFNRWLLVAESTGQLARLRREYGLPEGRTATPLAALLSGMSERLSLMKAVADAKRVLAVAIENPQREEVVLDAAVRAIRETAQETRSDPPDANSVRRFFQAQIEAAKWIQRDHLEQAPTSSASTHSIDREQAETNLDEIIRPALIDLGHRISMLILACAAEGRIALEQDDVAQAFESHHLPKATLQAIYEALSEIVNREKAGEPARPPSRARTGIAPSESTQTTHP